ncbi:hypothetical protein PQC39_gp059 [Vibrio phage Vp_R1]|uniref:Uncharacterized protein n=1 Tax=Vibrio phage Vp_R1 TaxID=2059867 RepID=A0A2H5BQ11_9CAUD|nr:hypothetical protein PQC39_gp059 [Vibrio phage Vp_R1]AUG88423.1 hypothetical protein VPR_059 [Vibrio phage Vp_R1]
MSSVTLNAEPRFFGSVDCGKIVVGYVSEKVYLKVSELGNENVLCLNDNTFRTLTTFSRVYVHEDTDLMDLLEESHENGL